MREVSASSFKVLNMRTTQNIPHGVPTKNLAERSQIDLNSLLTEMRVRIFKTYSTRQTIGLSTTTRKKPPWCDIDDELQLQLIFCIREEQVNRRSFSSDKICMVV